MLWTSKNSASCCCSFFFKGSRSARPSCAAQDHENPTISAFHPAAAAAAASYLYHTVAQTLKLTTYCSSGSQGTTAVARQDLSFVTATGGAYACASAYVRAMFPVVLGNHRTDFRDLGFALGNQRNGRCARGRQDETNPSSSGRTLIVRHSQGRLSRFIILRVDGRPSVTHLGYPTLKLLYYV